MILAIDTSTRLISVAIGNSDGVVSEIFLNTSTSHSENLLPMIDFLLKRAGVKLKQVNGIAVTIGPGSFIGLRIGLTVAKTLSGLYKVPIYGIPTLDALAANLLDQNTTLCCILEAPGKDNIYDCIYRIKNRTLKKLTKYTFESIPILINKLRGYEMIKVIGNTVDKYQKLFNSLNNIIIPKNKYLHYLRASIFISLAINGCYKYTDHTLIRPIYLKPLKLNVVKQSK